MPKKPSASSARRIILYTALLMLGATAMLLALSTLSPITVSCTRVPGVPYVLDQGNVRNEFPIRIFNNETSPSTSPLPSPAAPRASAATGTEAGVEVGPLGEQMRPIIVVVPRDQVQGSFPLEVKVTSPNGRDVIKKTVTFVGPGY